MRIGLFQIEPDLPAECYLHRDVQWMPITDLAPCIVDHRNSTHNYLHNGSLSEFDVILVGEDPTSGADPFCLGLFAGICHTHRLPLHFIGRKNAFFESFANLKEALDVLFSKGVSFQSPLKTVEAETHELYLLEVIHRGELRRSFERRSKKDDNTTIGRGGYGDVEWVLSILPHPPRTPTCPEEMAAAGDTLEQAFALWEARYYKYHDLSEWSPATRARERVYRYINTHWNDLSAHTTNPARMRSWSEAERSYDLELGGKRDKDIYGDELPWTVEMLYDYLREQLGVDDATISQVVRLVVPHRPPSPPGKIYYAL